MPVSPMTSPSPSHHQYRSLVVKTGTTAGQHDMLSACGSGWCFVRCTLTPSPPHAPLGEASCGQEWYKHGSHWLWAHVLLSAIDHLELSRVLFHRPSSFFICNPQCPQCLYTPWEPLMPTPSPTGQASSSQEQYYIGSTWHLVSIWVRLTCLFEGTSGASSHGNSSSMSGY